MEKPFDIAEEIRFGWETFKANIPLFLIAGVIEAVILGILYGLSSHSHGIIWLIFHTIAFAASLFLSIGMITIVLGVLDGRKPDISELFGGAPLFVNFLIANFVSLVGFLLGLLPGIFFILSLLWALAGIYLSLRFIFAVFHVVDRKADGVSALQQSWNATQRMVLDLFIFIIVLIVLNIIGAIPLGLGLFVTMPISMIAMAHVYRKVTG